MREGEPGNSDYVEEPVPVRPPTRREKFSVLLPALIALLGLAAMLIIFAFLASMN